MHCRNFCNKVYLLQQYILEANTVLLDTYVALATNIPRNGYVNSFYAALLRRRGPHIASHSVYPSVCLSVRLSVRPVIKRHVAPPSELK